MKTLICTVGLPYSGKTTWALKQGHPIVSPDAMRISIHGQRYSEPAEKIVWAIVEYMIDALFISGHDKVIIDATNNSRKRRDHWFEWCKERDYRAEFKFIETSAKECISRAKAQNDYTIIPIIERMEEERDWRMKGDEKAS